MKTDEVMVIKGKTARVEDVLSSVERFAEQAKLVALDLATAAAGADQAKCIPHNVNEEIMNLVDQTNTAASQILEMVKLVRMEMGGLCHLTLDGEVKLEKSRELISSIESNLKKILEGSDKVFVMIKKLKSLSLDNLVV